MRRLWIIRIVYSDTYHILLADVNKVFQLQESKYNLIVSRLKSLHEILTGVTYCIM